MYPPSCICCGELLEKQARYICRSCELKLHYLNEPTCLKCGKEIENEELEFCGDCMTHKRSFIRGFPLLSYNDPIKESLYRFKYKGKKKYGTYYAQIIAKKYGDIFKDLDIDVLVPVPVHRKKLNKRGYNQAEVLANELGRIINIPVDGKLLIRSQNTMPQKKLDNVGREENLRNAFKTSGVEASYRRVLLVDDIYTTGSTIEACTRALNKIGINEIYYTSVCIGNGF